MMRAGTIEVSGGKLETGWWGPGPTEAPTIVLLHEGLGSVALWRDVPERLAASTGYGVFAYSRFGYGGSDTTRLPRPMTYLHDEALLVLPKVLQAAEINRAVIVGHSDGGSIAAIYAGSSLARSVAAGTMPATSSWPGSSGPPIEAPSNKHDDTAENPLSQPTLLGLITIAAHFIVEDQNITSIHQIRADYDTGPLRQRLSRHHGDVDIAFRGWNDAWLDPRFRDFDITAYLPHIHAPILGLQGADDPYGSDIQLRVLADNVQAPLTTQLIPGAKHSPHLEATEETLAAITRFIRDIPK